jgi:hypothetical protein
MKGWIQTDLQLKIYMRTASSQAKATEPKITILLDMERFGISKSEMGIPVGGLESDEASACKRRDDKVGADAEPAP